MPESFQIGPFLLKTEWLILALAGLAGYLAIKKRLQIASYSDERISRFMGTLENTVLLNLLVWKFSFVLFHPLKAWQNPISIIYFSGGERGIWLSLIVGILYLYYSSRKENVAFAIYGDIAITGVTGAMLVYNILALVTEGQPLSPSNPFLLKAILAILIFVGVFRNRKVGYLNTITQALLWFSIGQLVITFFYRSGPSVLGGFSQTQIIYFILAVIALILDFYIGKRPTP